MGNSCRHTYCAAGEYPDGTYYGPGTPNGSEIKASRTDGRVNCVYPGEVITATIDIEGGRLDIYSELNQALRFGWVDIDFASTGPVAFAIGSYGDDNHAAGWTWEIEQVFE